MKELLSSNTLKGRFAKGGVVLTSASFVENGIRLLRNVILARLLAPDSFGLMATIVAIISLLTAITEIGIRQSVIQNKNSDSYNFLNIAWWLSVIRGGVLCFIAILISPLIIKFYDKPEMLLPLQAACFILLFNGLISPKVHILEKRMDYLRWIVIKITSTFLGVICAIIISLSQPSIWALVLGFIIEYSTACVFSFIIVPFTPKFYFDKINFKEIISYSRKVLGLPILTSIFQRIDVFTIGKVLTMSDLGFYSIAQNLAFSLNMAFTKIVRPLLLPVFSELQDNPLALKNSLIKIFKLISIITMPVIAFTIIFAKPILSILYGDKYAIVSIPFSILMIYVIIRFYTTIIMQLYFAIGRPDIQRTFAIIRVILGISFIYPAVRFGGLPGAALTILGSMAITLILQIMSIHKLVQIGLSVILKSLLAGVLISFFVLIPGLFFKSFVQTNNLLSMVICFIFCVFAWIYSLKTYLPDHLKLNFIFANKTE